MQLNIINPMSMTATVEIQALIREAIFGESDTAALALDDLLKDKPELLAIAVVVAYRLKPYQNN